jgi:tetratricopeptide (TPR) repeat protein
MVRAPAQGFWPMRMDDEEPSDAFEENLDRAWELVADGDFAEALKLAELTLEMEADSPDAHNLLGYIHAAGGNAQKALEHYYRAIEVDEFFVEAMLNAADLLIHPIGDASTALRLLDDALSLCDTDEERTEALVLKVECLLHLGEREQATEAVAALPEGPFPTARLAFMVGKARFETGEVEAAESLLRDARSREPHNADAAYFLGLVLETRGDRSAATVEFLMTRMLDARAPSAPWALSQEHFERRVRSAIKRLAPALSDKLEGSLVVVSDLPGIEVVAEGVDPRLVVLLDDVPPPEEAPDSDRRVGRCFVYQRNLERAALGPSELTDEVRHSLERELLLVFPELESEAGEAPPERETIPPSAPPPPPPEKAKPRAKIPKH